MTKLKVAIGVFVLTCLLAAAFLKTHAASPPSFQPATVVQSVEPVYPQNTASAGTVVLAVNVDATGDVEDVKIAKSAAGFDDAALDAIKGWKFQPATVDGAPVPSVVPVAFSFSWPAVCAGGEARRPKR